MPTTSRSTTWVLALASVASLMAALDAMIVSALLSLAGAIAVLGLAGRPRTAVPAVPAPSPALETT